MPNKGRVPNKGRFLKFANRPVFGTPPCTLIHIHFEVLDTSDNNNGQISNPGLHILMGIPIRVENNDRISRL